MSIVNTQLMKILNFRMTVIISIQKLDSDVNR